MDSEENHHDKKIQNNVGTHRNNTKQRKKMLQDLKDKKNLLFPKGLFETTTAK